MSGRSLQKAARELLHSRSAAARAARICAMVVLAQSVLFVVRAPFSSPDFDHLAMMRVDTDDTARYRNSTHVNGKALVSLLAQVVQTMKERIRLDDETLKGPERVAHLKRVSDDQFWTVKRTLEQVLPEARVVAPAAAPSERADAAPLPLPARYLAELHKVVLFDQWLPAGELTVWLSPLSDSEEDARYGGLNASLTSVCVTHRGRPQMAAVLASGTVHWGLYGRGNDLGLTVGPPMWELPERFGISIDSAAAGDLARRAFDEDVDLYRVANLDRNMLGALSVNVDGVLLTEPWPLRKLCTGHLFMRLYGGKVTDLAGREVQYPADGGSTEGTVFAALYYHQKMLQQVLDAKAGKNVTRE